MPTLPAAGYAYQPFPSSSPSTAAPQGYQRISSSPADFGAQEGQALSQLGATLERAGTSLADQYVKEQEMWNVASAQKAENEFNKLTNTLMYGDATTGEVGFLAKRGQDSAAAWPVVSKQINDLRDAARKGLYNEPQRIRFDAAVSDTLNRKLAQASTHYNNELKQWNADEGKAKVQIAAQTADAAIAAGDVASFDAETAKGVAAVETGLRQTEATPAQIQAATTSFRQDRAVTFARTLADKDPVKARDFVEMNGALLGDKKAALLDHVRVRADEREATRLARGARGGGNPAVVNEMVDVLRQRGWSDAAIEGALNNAQSESEFNPEAKGAAGERGLFQFHPASHIGPFQADFKDWSVKNQVTYMANIVEQSMPGYKTSSDGRLATRDFLRGFEKPKDQSDTEVDRRYANRMTPSGVSLKQTTDKINQSAASPEVKDRAINKARQDAQMEHADQQHQRQIKMQADKDADDATEGDYNRRIAAKDPTITAQSILEDPRWRDPTAARRQVQFFEAATRVDPDHNTNNNNSIELFRRITLPEGDPQGIRTREPLDQALISKQITRPTYDKLRADLKEEVVGGSLAERNKNVSATITAARPFIRPYAAWGKEMEDYQDKDAASREALYMGWVQDRVRQQIETGKDWRALFRDTINGNPNPDYVRSPENLAQFKPQESQVKNGAKDTPAQKRQAVDDFTTVEGVKKAYKAGRINLQTLKEKAKALGYDLVDEMPGQVPVR